MEIRGERKFYQSLSGFIVELDDKGNSRRINVAEMELLKLPEDIITSKKNFYSAYGHELMLLQQLHQQVKNKVEEDKKKVDEEATTEVPDIKAEPV
jgi:hypothetical protein